MFSGKKKVIIVHGWGCAPDSDWYSWLGDELKKKGFSVDIPEMPEPEAPEIDKWVRHLAKTVSEPDEIMFFVGHSIGCQTILRYLETLENKKVGGAVFVAGWFNLDNLEKDEIAVAEQWIKTPINFLKAKNALKNQLIVFLSDDEPYGYVEENKKTFESQLGAEIVVLKNKGHFNQETFPELLEAILKVSSSKS